MDSLEEYVINHSSCVMPRCEYAENGIDIDCDECQKRMIAEHDAKIRADERAKAERDFQNSDYWNEYLEKVLADERNKAIEDCKEVVRQHWINGTVAHRIAEEIYGDLDKLKEPGNETHT